MHLFDLAIIWLSMRPCDIHSRSQRGPTAVYAAFKNTYKKPILPLDLTNVNGDVIHSPPTMSSDDDTSSESEDDSVLPPSTHRPPGRPKKRRIRDEYDEIKRPKHKFKYSRCGKNRHSWK